MSTYPYPLTNAGIAEQIDLLGKLMDIFGENAFKVKAYSGAAYSLKKMPQNIAELHQEEILQLKIVGDSVRAKILELLQTGTIQVLDGYKQQTPEGVLEMMKIKGLGPKKIALLWKELEITSIGELEYACEENRLMTFKGFGAKTQAEILKNITFLKNATGWFLWKQIDDSWLSFKDTFHKQFSKDDVVAVGSYCRQLPVLQQMELLIRNNTSEVIVSFLEQQHFESISVEDDVILGLDSYHIPWRINLSASGEFGRKQLLLSSSEAFMTTLQSTYTLPTAANNEQGIFQQLQLPFIPPYLRENATLDSVVAAANNANIVTETSVKGIIHSHSTWSDGLNTIEEMAKAAIAVGKEYLVLSDHSKSAFYANGLSVERIKAQHKEIDILNEQLAPFKIFKSIEADILNDGSLDYDDEVLALFDLVIASIHSNLKMTEDKAMERLLAAVANPYTTILGHPTGRLLLSRPGYSVDFHQLIEACRQHNVVVEINAHPRRLDMDWQWISNALEANVMLSINPDAHAVEHLQLIKYGVMAAQKGGLPATSNLSSLSLIEFEAFLQQNRNLKLSK